MPNARSVPNIDCDSGDTTYTQDHYLKMNEIKKLNAENAFTSFSDLPEDIVFQILNKLTDLKTLCLCKHVSRRFYHIVLQVEAISFTCFTNPFVDHSYLATFGSAIKSLMKFERVKSLCIQLPSSLDKSFSVQVEGDTTYTQDHYLKMNEIKKLNAENAFTSFSDLPEDIVFQILNKLTDLKTLCLCKHVSRRFYHIVLQVEAISFTCFTNPFVDHSYLATFGSAIKSLMKFERVKSLCIQLPSSLDNHSLCKWKVNFKVKFDSFIYLSPNSVCLKKEFKANESAHQEGEEDMALTLIKAEMLACLGDMIYMITLLSHIIRLPMLEEVSITDSRKRGKVSVSGRKVAEVRNWLSSPSDETIAQKLKYFLTARRVSRCYVPLLEFSGYVMTGVKLYVVHWNDPVDYANVSFMKSDNDDAFEDKEEAVYNEAVMEIFKKHIDRIVRVDL
ncbi:F-box domain, Leucine-rich repeat domain, L domain-like protein [Artemisia annua]|uniref:F-box domain, Leucine-rich repeat domain, L domain-like protein n=1 Tax=Artemisia annua TaxID=35608 RepID=A0A2U1NZK0_ARTAN|nr:F-box domain, Leucine-rich repeat domain, L domain-like protein [Artemisia annua]